MARSRIRLCTSREGGAIAVDGGNGFVCTAADQWGQPRPADGDGVAVEDIGAVEASLVFADGFESGSPGAWSGVVP
jgi:hypothetical protein